MYEETLMELNDHHFRNMTYTDQETRPFQIKEQDKQTDITEIELERTMAEMSTGKAPGVDSIILEILREFCITNKRKYIFRIIKYLCEK